MKLYFLYLFNLKVFLSNYDSQTSVTSQEKKNKVFMFTSRSKKQTFHLSIAPDNVWCLIWVSFMNGQGDLFGKSFYFFQRFFTEWWYAFSYTSIKYHQSLFYYKIHKSYSIINTTFNKHTMPFIRHWVNKWNLTADGNVTIAIESTWYRFPVARKYGVRWRCFNKWNINNFFRAFLIQYFFKKNDLKL